MFANKRSRTMEMIEDAERTAFIEELSRKTKELERRIKEEKKQSEAFGLKKKGYVLKKYRSWN